MKTREQIDKEKIMPGILKYAFLRKDVLAAWTNQLLMLEVMLDIRDLLVDQKAKELKNLRK